MTPMVEIRSEEADLIDRLRGGDEAAFVSVVNAYSASLKRLALAFVPSDAVAEEVVQETWLAVLTGIARFEGRSSVKTWIFKILANRAKTRAIREKRTISFSELNDPFERDEPAVDPARFLPASHPTWPGHWTSPLDSWSASAEDAVVGRETLGVVQRELDRLPPAQRVVQGVSRPDASRDSAHWQADHQIAGARDCRLPVELFPSLEGIPDRAVTSGAGPGLHLHPTRHRRVKAKGVCRCKTTVFVRFYVSGGARHASSDAPGQHPVAGLDFHRHRRSPRGDRLGRRRAHPRDRAEPSRPAPRGAERQPDRRRTKVSRVHHTTRAVSGKRSRPPASRHYLHST